jgi:hypothetical protein
MTEVARAIVLPDIGRIHCHKLLSLLLIWESIDLVNVGRLDEDDADADAIRELATEGLVLESRKPSGVEPLSSKEVDEQWRSLPWQDLASDPETFSRLVNQGIDRLLADKVREIHASNDLAAELGVGTVALNAFAAKTAALPVVDNSMPIEESTLIQAASRGVQVSPDTKVEDVLAFREGNRDLMGRFRAAVIDLAGAIDAESPTIAAEQAYAVVANRIEPELARLDAALSESRLRFAWNTIMGASAVVLGDSASAAAVATGAGSVITRNLHYAFDRDRYVRDHPFGLLQRARNEFGVSKPGASPTTITDPEAEARTEYLAILGREIAEAINHPAPGA